MTSTERLVLASTILCGMIASFFFGMMMAPHEPHASYPVAVYNAPVDCALSTSKKIETPKRKPAAVKLRVTQSTEITGASPVTAVRAPVTAPASESARIESSTPTPAASKDVVEMYPNRLDDPNTSARAVHSYRSYFSKSKPTSKWCAGAYDPQRGTNFAPCEPSTRIDHEASGPGSGDAAGDGGGAGGAAGSGSGGCK